MAPRHIALAVLVAAVWGFNFTVVRFGLDTFPPLLLTALRFVVAGLPVFFLPRPAISWMRLVLVALTMFLGHFVLIFFGIAKGMPPGLASLTLQAQAFFTILIAAFVLRETPSRRQMAGMAVAFAGLALISFSVGGDVTYVGLALTLGAALSWAIGNVLMRGTGRVDMLAMVVWMSALLPLPSFALSLAFEGWPAIVAAFRAADLLAYGTVFYLAVPTTILGFGIWGLLLKLYPAATVAPFTLLVPLFGMLFAALTFGERFPPVRLAGVALIVCGLVILALPLGKLRKLGRARAG
ncbi:EamA family transporter [Xanthobacteraceae bacterium A53D]